MEQCRINVLILMKMRIIVPSFIKLTIAIVEEVDDFLQVFTSNSSSLQDTSRGPPECNETKINPTSCFPGSPPTLFYVHFD